MVPFIRIYCKSRPTRSSSRSTIVAVSQLATTWPMNSAMRSLGAGQQRPNDAFRRGLQPRPRGRVGFQDGAEIAQRRLDISNDAAVRPGDIGFQRHADARPDIPHPGLDRLMRHHPPDRRADFGRAGGFGFHAVDLPPHPFVERQPQFRPVRAHFIQFGVDQRQHPPRDRGAERPADQAPALFAHPLLDRGAQRVFPAGQRGFQLAQDEAEHLLVAAAVDQAVQCPRDHLSGGRAHRRCAAPRGREPDAPARPPRVASSFGSMPASATAAGCAAAGSARNRCRMPGRSSRASTLDTSCAGENVVGDETAQAPGPAARAGSGMMAVCGIGMPKRMPKQRGHREPIGDAADEPGLRGGLQQARSTSSAASGRWPGSGRPSGPAGRRRTGGGCARSAGRGHRDRVRSSAPV